MTESSETRPEFSRDDAAGRYEIAVDGVRVGLADFYERDGVVVIPHTETLPAYGGRGLAGQLVGYALDDIAAQRKRVRPDCPFVAAYIRRHPEYQPLVAD